MNSYGFWGPSEGIDTHDYILELEGDTPASPPKKLPGHSLDNANIDQSDALTITRVKLVGGQFKTVVITKRAPEERGRQYTIGLPNGALDSPVLAAALRPGCRKEVYAKYLCPADKQFNHADILKSALFDPPQPAGAIIAIADINPVDYTSVIRISEQVRQFELGWTNVFTETIVPDMEYHAIGFLSADCAGCEEVPGQTFVMAGGDGVAIPSLRKTTDRFGSVPTTLVDAGTIAQFGEVLFTEGNLIIVGYADKGRLTAGTGLAGGLKVSRDGGLSWAAASGVAITVPIYGIARLGEAIIAVGGTGAGVPVVFASFSDGKSWVSVTNALLTGTAALLSISADSEGEVAYMAGETGKLISVKVSGTSIQMSDLSANLPGTPATLNRVHVFSKGFIAVGGAAGYYAESYNGGVSFVEVGVAGSTPIGAIAGDRYRAVVGAGSNLFIRDVLTDMEFQQVVLEGGAVITGNVTDVQMRTGSLDDFNFFAAITDTGSVILGKDFRPTS